MKLDLSLSENDEILKNAALDFMKHDAPSTVIQALQESDTGYTPELWRNAVESGWLGIVIPKQYGGTGGSLTSAGVLFEALGTGPMPGPYFSSGILSALILQEAATDEQKRQILPGISQGTEIVTLAMTEPEAGWESQNIQMLATRDDNFLTLNGWKLFAFDAGAATHFIVVARTNQISGSDEGISLILVDSKTAGIKVRRLSGFLTGTMFEIGFDNVRVPLENIIGKEGKGWCTLQEGINKAIPVLCAYKVGASQNIIEQTIEYSRTRTQFNQPIGRFQRVQDWIIDMVNYADAARLITYETLWKLDIHKPSVENVHLAKTVASEAYYEIVTMAHRVFSGVSYVKGHPISFHTRASRSLFTYLGGPAYHRQQLAKLLIANPDSALAQ